MQTSLGRHKYPTELAEQVMGSVGTGQEGPDYAAGTRMEGFVLTVAPKGRGLLGHPGPGAANS